MLGSNPNLVWTRFLTREIQKSRCREPKTHPSTHADRQTPKTGNGPLDLKTGMDKVFETKIKSESDPFKYKFGTGKVFGPRNPTTKMSVLIHEN